MILINTITVDPGWYTGLAYWSGNLEPDFKLIKVRRIGKKKLTWEEKIDSMSIQFKAYCHIVKPQTVYIESTTVYAQSAKSMSATRHLMHLNVLIGEYRRGAKEAGANKIKLLEPMEWKGQLSKKATDLRIKRINGLTYPSHISDAVGIGLSIQGLL